MLSRDIERIMKENERYTKMLEEYDRTGKLAIEKIRRSFTLKRETIEGLKKISLKKGTSMSGLIEELVERETL